MLKMFRFKLAVAAILLGVCRAQDANFDCQCVAYSFCKDSDMISSHVSVDWKIPSGADNENKLNNSCSCKCDSFQEVCCKVQRIKFQGNFKCGMRGKISSYNFTNYYKGKPSQQDLSKSDRFRDVDWNRIRTGDNPDTFYGEYPWMVAIMKIIDDKRTFLCGGSILYPNVILTAAHSVSELSESQLIVKAGVWNTSSTLEAHQDIAVSRIIVHSKFNKNAAEWDFAILILSESLKISNYVAPICLPSPTQNYNRSSCVAIGWGADDFGSTDMPNVLKQLVVPLVDFSSCEAKLKSVPTLGPSFKLHNSYICAGREQADTCTGDGGGPLMCPTINDPDQFVQVGITSWGVECGKGGVPGVYASTSAAYTWIDGILIEEQVKLIEETYPDLNPEVIKQQD